MSKIKIQVLDPFGTPTHEIETNYPSNQLDRFLAQHRIVVFSDDEPVSFVSDRHRWNPLNQNKDDRTMDKLIESNKKFDEKNKPRNDDRDSYEGGFDSGMWLSTI